MMFVKLRNFLDNSVRMNAKKLLVIKRFVIFLKKKDKEEKFES